MKSSEISSQNDYELSWLNIVLDAEMWFALASLTSKEAAMLLCRLNPNDKNCDPTTIATDETEPEEFIRMLRVFVDLEKAEPKARNLYQWLTIARDKGLKYHSWIDEYAQARIEKSPADAGSKGGTVIVGSDEAAVTAPGLLACGCRLARKC